MLKKEKYISPPPFGFSPIGRTQSRIGAEYLVIRMAELSQSFSTLEGKILTILEASITNEKQLESVKSLVKNSIWDINGSIHACDLTIEEFNSIKRN